MDCRTGFNAPRAQILFDLRGRILVPKKGLEPPHPCGYMDLNHARLPIPPLRLMGECAAAQRTAAPWKELQKLFLQREYRVSNNSRCCGELSCRAALSSDAWRTRDAGRGHGRK